MSTVYICKEIQFKSEILKFLWFRSCLIYFTLDLLLERNLILQQGHETLFVSKNRSQYEHHF